MKKVIKRMITICLLSVLFCTPIKANDTEEKVRDMQEEMEKVSYNKVDDEVLNFAKIAKDFFNDCQNIDIKEIEVEKPFYMYSLDSRSQAMNYKYPVSYNGKVIFVIDAICTVDGWTYSATTDSVELLNKINYCKDNDDYIFFTEKGSLYAQSIYLLISSDGSDTSWLVDFDEKVNTINQRLDELKQCDSSKIENNDTKDCAYTRSFSDNTTLYKRLKLYKQQPQGQYRLCWAASAATTLNYLKGTATTAKQVANKMGIGYYAGGTYIDTQNALNKYGTFYPHTGAYVLSWSGIKSNISNKYSFIISAKTSSSGHQVTGYGYRDVDATHKYVIIWNSATAASEIFKYNGANSYFMMNSEAYVWKNTVAYK